MSAKIWFITGVSSGLGRDMAREVAKAGHTVVGTVRKHEQIAEVDALHKGNTFGYILDVNDHAAVTAVVAAVVERFGRIDVLVNNAGYGLVGAIEETSMEEARAQMETNVFGALAVTQAVLPVMRKQGGGHIFQVSSIAGLAGTAGLGVYNASKFALEGFSEALYHEVKPLGIRVTLVEPGPFRTEWAGASMKHTALNIDAYANTAHTTEAAMAARNGNQPGDPVRAAQALLEVERSANPPLRLLLGKWAVMGLRKKIEWLTADLETWEAVSVGADYPA